MKYILNNTAKLFNIPIFQKSLKKPSFYSKVYNLTVKEHIHIPDNHIHVSKFPQKQITNQLQKTTLSTGIPSFQLLQNHYSQLSFTETYDPKPQAQYIHVIVENKTKGPIDISKGILGHIDFPEECNVTQKQPQPYTIYNLNQVTQTPLCNYNPHTFEVHKEQTYYHTI